MNISVFRGKIDILAIPAILDPSLNNIVYSTWSKFEKGVSKKKSYCVCLCPLSSLSSVQTIMVPYRTVFEQSVLLCFEGEHFEGYQ